MPPARSGRRARSRRRARRPRRSARRAGWRSLRTSHEPPWDETRHRGASGTAWQGLALAYTGECKGYTETARIGGETEASRKEYSRTTKAKQDFPPLSLFIASFPAPG